MAGRKKTESLAIAGQTYTTTTEYNYGSELTKYAYRFSTVVDGAYTHQLTFISSNLPQSNPTFHARPQVDSPCFTYSALSGLPACRSPFS